MAELDAVAWALVIVWNRGARQAAPATSTSQLSALFVVERRPLITLQELARELGSRPSTASRLCDRLQKAGLLLRAPGSVDRREVTLRLSRGGGHLLRRVRGQRRAHLARVLAEMRPCARRSLVTGLAAFQAAAAEVSARP